LRAHNVRGHQGRGPRPPVQRSRARAREQLVDLRAERLRLQRELEAAKADAADAAAKAAKRVAALEADLNEARARSGKAAADVGAGKSKLCTIL